MNAHDWGNLTGEAHVVSQVGAMPSDPGTVQLGLQVDALNADVVAMAATGDPSALAFAADEWAGFQARWALDRNGSSTPLSEDVAQYEILLKQWTGMGFPTKAKHLNADGSVAFFANINLTTFEAAGAAAATAATVYLAYDVWKSRKRR